MPSSILRTFVVAAGSAGLLLAVTACHSGNHDAPRHNTNTPAATVIVVPSPDQVTGWIDASDMDWLSRATSGTAGR